MSKQIEKTFELIDGEDGIILAIRPALPFVAEDFLIKPGIIMIRGEGRQLPLPIHREQADILLTAQSMLICEFPLRGDQPTREVVVIRHE